MHRGQELMAVAGGIEEVHSPLQDSTSSSSFDDV
jgi:hypothetical protein